MWLVGPSSFSWSQCKIADRVVEIQNVRCTDNDILDLRTFQRLERVRLRRLPAILLDHGLQNVHNTIEHDIDPADYFLFEWAECAVLVLRTEDAFDKTKQHPFPPHLHVFFR